MSVPVKPLQIRADHEDLPGVAPLVTVYDGQAIVFDFARGVVSVAGEALMPKVWEGDQA